MRLPGLLNRHASLCPHKGLRARICSYLTSRVSPCLEDVHVLTPQLRPSRRFGGLTAQGPQCQACQHHKLCTKIPCHFQSAVCWSMVFSESADT